MEHEAGTHVVYVPFKGSTMRERTEMLHRNNMNNIKSSHEFLNDINMFEEAEYKGKIGKVRNLLLSIKMTNNKRLFNRIDQSTRKNKNKKIILHSPSIRWIVEKWLREEHGKNFKVKRDHSYSTSISESNREGVGKGHEDYMKHIQKEPLTKEERNFRGFQKRKNSHMWNKS